MKNAKTVAPPVRPHRLRLLYSRSEIADRVADLAQAIDRDYGASEIVIVGILRGTFVFLADLVRQLTAPVVIDFVGTSSYGSLSESSQRISVTKDLQVAVEGKQVLAVEDILDTGLTLDFVVKFLRARGPASVRTCVLIDKRERRVIPVAADYVGFRLDRGFVVGYGIDFADRYRQLPEIYRLEFADPAKPTE